MEIMMNYCGDIQPWSASPGCVMMTSSRNKNESVGETGEAIGFMPGGTDSDNVSTSHIRGGYTQKTLTGKLTGKLTGRIGEIGST